MNKSYERKKRIKLHDKKILEQRKIQKPSKLKEPSNKFAWWSYKGRKIDRPTPMLDALNKKIND